MVEMTTINHSYRKNYVSGPRQMGGGAGGVRKSKNLFLQDNRQCVHFP
jgi:hypothetical protein